MNKQFGKICSLLDFLNSNKEQLKPIGLDNLFSGEQLQNEYENWLRLLSKLENPIDNEFFKTTWVPIDKSDLTCFIDIEDPNMAIFRPSDRIAAKTANILVINRYTGIYNLRFCNKICTFIENAQLIIN